MQGKLGEPEKNAHTNLETIGKQLGITKQAVRDTLNRGIRRLWRDRNYLQKVLNGEASRKPYGERVKNDSIRRNPL